MSFQDGWGFADKWELVAGIRYDHYSDIGGTLNPRLALVWQTRDDLAMKFLYGRAFRPPAFNELYNKNNPSNLGNEYLDPETIQTIEFVTDNQSHVDLHLRLNLFHYDAEDLIELVQDPGRTTYTSRNKKNQEGNGFELETEFQAARNFLIKGNLAFQDSKDKGTEESVPDTLTFDLTFRVYPCRNFFAEMVGCKVWP